MMVTKNDILEALGMEARDRFLTGMFVGIGVGALIGSAVAMLLSPKSGRELRDLIGNKGNEWLGKAKHKKEDVLGEMREKT
jgi:gas vesicle protein